MEIIIRILLLWVVSKKDEEEWDMSESA